jgi:hypothetical protein
MPVADDNILYRLVKPSAGRALKVGGSVRLAREIVQNGYGASAGIDPEDSPEAVAAAASGRTVEIPTLQEQVGVGL